MAVSGETGRDSRETSPPHESDKVTSVLLLSFTFAPDVGGIETHLTDLVAEIKKRPFLRAFICTCKPIVTPIRHYLRRECDGNVEIRRWWWFGGTCGGNIFRRLEPWPVLLFLYATPYFFVRALWFMAWRWRTIDVIHVHGLNMAFVGALLGWLFRKPVVMQTHAIYSFVPGSLFATVSRFVLCRMKRILALSTASREELLSLGVPADRVGEFRYWIDLQAFAPNASERSDHASVLFVGRLIHIKGVAVVCALAKRFPGVQFVIAGDGPDRGIVDEACKALPNLHMRGLVGNRDLPSLYRQSHVTLVPSQYPEGFGRVICESLACGTPVIASDVGGIRDAMDETVGVFCRPDEESFAAALGELLDDRSRWSRLQTNCRSFAAHRFSYANADAIFALYDQ